MLEVISSFKSLRAGLQVFALLMQFLCMILQTTWSAGTGGVLDVCLCLGCGGVGGVVGEWVCGLDHGLEAWGL